MILLGPVRLGKACGLGWTTPVLGGCLDGCAPFGGREVDAEAPLLEPFVTLGGPDVPTSSMSSSMSVGDVCSRLMYVRVLGTSACGVEQASSACLGKARAWR